MRILLCGTTRSLGTTRRWVWPAALSAVLWTAPLLAQDGRAASANAPAAHASRGPSAASLTAGVRLRLVLLDDSLLFGRFNQRPGILGDVEGSLVALEPTSVQVSLASGDTIAFPSNIVRRLEVSAGPGLCQSSDGVRVACNVAAVLTTAALSTWAGDKVARQLAEDEPSRQKWRLRGGVSGAVLTLPFLHLLGRDRWVEVPDWPAPGR